MSDDQWRERRRDEPAAAPLEADAEAGEQVAPPPRDPVEIAARRDVRAGPGDAGASQRPEPLPHSDPRSDTPTRDRRTWLWSLAAIAALFVLILLLS